MTIIHSASAPAAVGTYSQARVAGQVVYLSGQIGIDPKTGKLVDGFGSQVTQVIQNLEAVCVAAGVGLKNIQKLTVLLQDLNDFTELNALMTEHWPEPYPARAAFEVARLPLDALVEIDAIAHLDVE